MGACAVPLLAGLILAPLALHQSSLGHADWIEDQTLAMRTWDVVETMLVGQTGTHFDAAVVAMALASIAALILLATRTDAAERHALRVPLTLVAAGLGAPLALALVGADFVVARNFLFLAAPLTIVLGAGLAAGRGGPAAVAATLLFASTSLALVVSVPATDELRRERITARLIPGPADDGLDGLTIRFAFRRAPEGVGVAATARCPSGLRAFQGRGSWVSPTLRSVPVAGGPAGRPPQGWQAHGVPPTGDDILQVYAVCGRF